MVRKPARPSPWYDVGWALAAGLAGAAGLLLAYLDIGLLGTVVAFALMEVTVAPVAWRLITEEGRPGRPAIFEVRDRSHREVRPTARPPVTRTRPRAVGWCCGR